MIDRHATALLAIASLALCAPDAWAESPAPEEIIACEARNPRAAVGLLIGFGLHLDDAGIGGPTTEAKDSAHTGLRAGWMLGSVLTLEGEVRLGSATFEGFDGALTTLGYRLGFLFHLWQGEYRPFVLLGHGGDFFFKESSGFDGAGGFVTNHLGVGLKIRYDARMGLRLETRAALNRADQRPTTGMIELSGGVYLEF